jgi:glycosyltransferase involved in cell wall biosynthesis
MPTYRRPELATRAARSALAQTLHPLELVAVVDGRDDATVAALAGLGDTRLRIVVPDTHLGNSSARNRGVLDARATWVAFLDDDDEWLPGKLAAQLRTAEASRHPLPIVSCRMIGRNELRDFAWPRRLPREGEPMSEYLLTRSSFFAGEGMVLTSMVFTRRELLRRVPFASHVVRYVDLDWILRASAVDGVGLEFVPEVEPLSVWNMELGRERISNQPDGAYALAFARERRQLFTPRSYAAFLLTVASAAGANGREWRVVFPLLSEALRGGTPNMVELATHFANFLLPSRAKRRAAVWFDTIRGQRTRAAAP